MRLSVDLDGVLCDCMAGLVPIINQLYPDKVPADYQPAGWEFPELTSEEKNAMWAEVRQTENFWLNLPPHWENARALYEIKLRAEIYYVTSRFDCAGQSALVQSSKWLVGVGLLTPNWTSVIVVGSAAEKAAVLRSIRVDACIDDKWETHSQCYWEGLNSYLLKRPWNEKPRTLYAEDPEGERAVDTIAEFLEIALEGADCEAVCATA